MTDVLLGVLVQAAIRSLGIALLVALVLGLLRVRSGSLRHAAWAGVLAAMLTMPILTRVMPSFSIAVPARHVDVARASSNAAALPAPDAFRDRGRNVASSMTAKDVTPVVTAPAAAGMPGMSTRPMSFSSAPLVALYLAVALVLLARLLLGWRAVARIRRESQPVAARAGRSDLTGVFESHLVTTPMTVGLAAPRVILPLGWESWPGDKLEAVLAHERAHVRRFDALVAFIAHLNRCVFWFHPLAWWLAHTLSTTAEHACDQEVVHTLRAPRRYAEVLIEMAQTVRSRRGRVAWQAVGVQGDGRLGQRIDAILRDDFAPPTRRQRLAVLGGCALVILIVVGCRTQTTPPPLKADPQLAKELAERNRRGEFYDAARRMTVPEAAALETTLAAHPEDTVTRERLLIFYQWTGRNTQDWNDNVAARRRHALWLTEHHPESDLIDMARLSKSADPVGYGQVRTLWLAHLGKPGATTKLLDHAARFFEESEKPMAEQLLLRAQASEPDGPTPRVANLTYYAPWSERLGMLYAQAIVGSVGSTMFNVVREIDATAARSEYAMEVRRKLEASRDAVLLSSAGSYLAINTPNVAADAERARLARSYAERALQIDPQSRTAKQTLEFIAQAEQFRQKPPQPSPFAGVPLASRGDVVAKMPPAERLPRLASLAVDEYGYASNMEYSRNRPDKKVAYPELAKDPNAIRAARERSKRYAQQALDLAATLPTDPAYANVIYKANLTLASNAWWDGDRKAAVRYMLAAAQAPKPANPADRRFPGVLEGKLTVALLKAGERDSVAEYLERSAEGREADQRERMRKEAAAIREGRMPERYQYLTADRDLN